MTQQNALAVDVPDLIEPIEGWRAWRVIAHDGRFALRSVVQPTVWPPGRPMLAKCLRPPPLLPWLSRRRGDPPAVPDPKCVCGIYAGRLDEIEPYLRRVPMPREAGRVLGRVHLWGTVIECERGFRAGHAYPSRIYVPTESFASPAQRGNGATGENLLAGLAAYGVPVELVAGRVLDAARALREHASPTTLAG